MKEFRISSSTGKAWDREVCKIRRRGKRKFKKRIKIQEKKIRDARERMSSSRCWCPKRPIKGNLGKCEGSINNGSGGDQWRDEIKGEESQKGEGEAKEEKRRERVERIERIERIERTERTEPNKVEQNREWTRWVQVGEDKI